MIGFHGLNNSYMFEDEQIGTYRPKIEEIINRTPKDHKDEDQEDSDAVSLKGRIVTNLIGHITNDLAIGKKIKSGELRKRLKEPKWKVPDCFCRYKVLQPQKLFRQAWFLLLLRLHLSFEPFQLSELPSFLYLKGNPKHQSLQMFEYRACLHFLQAL